MCRRSYSRKEMTGKGLAVNVQIGLRGERIGAELITKLWLLIVGCHLRFERRLSGLDEKPGLVVEDQPHLGPILVKVLLQKRNHAPTHDLFQLAEIPYIHEVRMADHVVAVVEILDTAI